MMYTTLDHVTLSIKIFSRIRLSEKIRNGHFKKKKTTTSFKQNLYPVIIASFTVEFTVFTDQNAYSYPLRTATITVVIPPVRQFKLLKTLVMATWLRLSEGHPPPPFTAHTAPFVHISRGLLQRTLIKTQNNIVANNLVTNSITE